MVCYGQALPPSTAVEGTPTVGTPGSESSASAWAVLRYECAVLRYVCAALKCECAVLRCVCAALWCVCAVLRCVCAVLRCVWAALKCVCAALKCVCACMLVHHFFTLIFACKRRCNCALPTVPFNIDQWSYLMTVNEVVDALHRIFPSCPLVTKSSKHVFSIRRPFLTKGRTTFWSPSVHCKNLIGNS